MLAQKNGEDDISIHAPAKGATLPNIRWISLGYYFNPRSREGSDFKYIYVNV